MRKLKDVVLKEVSLVGKPANKQSFVFVKQEENTDDKQEEMYNGIVEFFKSLEDDFNEAEQDELCGALGQLRDLDATTLDAIQSLILLPRLCCSPAKLAKAAGETHSWPSITARSIEKETVEVTGHERWPSLLDRD